MYKVASIQYAFSDKDSKEDRIKKAEKLIDNAAEADLILLPELWNFGWHALFDKTLEHLGSRELGVIEPTGPPGSAGWSEQAASQPVSENGFFFPDNSAYLPECIFCFHGSHAVTISMNSIDLKNQTTIYPIIYYT